MRASMGERSARPAGTDHDEWKMRIDDPDALGKGA